MIISTSQNDQNPDPTSAHLEPIQTNKQHNLYSNARIFEINTRHRSRSKNHIFDRNTGGSIRIDETRQVRVDRIKISKLSTRLSRNSRLDYPDRSKSSEPYNDLWTPPTPSIKTTATNITCDDKVSQVKKMLKTIVNGTAVLQYVLIESLTPPQFYNTWPI